MIEEIISYFSLAKNLILYVSYVFNIVSIIAVFYLYLSNTLITLYRLGRGLAKRDIAVFAKNDDYKSLEKHLVKSKLFKPERVHQIDKNFMDDAKECSIFIVHYNSYQDKLDDILALKGDSKALIVYAPQHEGRISDSDMIKINGKSNAVVVNLRGRLMNDVFTSLITTNF